MPLTNALIVIKILGKTGGTSTAISTQLASVLAHVSSGTWIVACNYNSVIQGENKLIDLYSCPAKTINFEDLTYLLHIQNINTYLHTVAIRCQEFY